MSLTIPYYALLYHTPPLLPHSRCHLTVDSSTLIPHLFLSPTYRMILSFACPNRIFVTFPTSSTPMTLRLSTFSSPIPRASSLHPLLFIPSHHNTADRSTLTRLMVQGSSSFLRRLDTYIQLCNPDSTTVSSTKQPPLYVVLSPYPQTFP